MSSSPVLLSGMSEVPLQAFPKVRRCRNGGNYYEHKHMLPTVYATTEQSREMCYSWVSPVHFDEHPGKLFVHPCKERATWSGSMADPHVHKAIVHPRSRGGHCNIKRAGADGECLHKPPARIALFLEMSTTNGSTSPHAQS